MISYWINSTANLTWHTRGTHGSLASLRRIGKGVFRWLSCWSCGGRCVLIWMKQIPQWADDEEQSGGLWECAALEEQDYVNVNEATTRWKFLVLRLLFGTNTWDERARTRTNSDEHGRTRTNTDGDDGMTG